MEPETLLRHRDFVRGLARGLLRDESRVDDVEQLTWAAALEREPREPSALRAWLATCAKNFARQLLREDRRRSAREGQVARASDFVGPSAEDVLSRERERRRVVEAVLDLGEPYRQAILLRFFEDQSHRQIARSLGVPVETARTRVKRGIQKLRVRLEAEHSDHKSYCLALSSLAGSSKSTVAVVLSGTLLGAFTMKILLGVGTAVVLSMIAWFVLRDVPSSPVVPTSQVAHGESVEGVAPMNPDESADRASRNTLVKDNGAGRGQSRESIHPVAAVTLSGQVVDFSGSPISGALVLSFPDVLSEAIPFGDARARDPRVRRGRTDSSGRFTIEISDSVANAHTLLAEAEGLSPVTVTLVTPEREVTLVLGRSRTMWGRVLTMDRAPIPGAKVRWLGLMSGAQFEREATSDANGVYRIEGIPSREAIRRSGGSRRQYWVETSCDGFAPLMLDWAAAPPRVGENGLGTNGAVEAPIEQNFVLVRGAEVHGRAIDGHSEEPLAGARVVLWSIEGLAQFEGITNPYGQRKLQETSTDESGRFHFDHVPAQGFHTSSSNNADDGGAIMGHVGVIARGHAMTTRHVYLKPDGERIDVELRAFGKATIRGRVVDDSGGPIERVRVYAKVNDRYPALIPPFLRESVASSSVWTNSLGQYVLEDVAVKEIEEPAEVFAHHSRTTARTSVQVTVRAGDDLELDDLVMRKVFGVRVLVVDRGGAPISGCFVEVEDSMLPRERTDAEGRAEFHFPNRKWTGPTGDFAGAGIRRITAYRAGYGLVMSEVFEPTTELPEVRMVMLPGRTVSGEVVFADGKPAAGARVQGLNGSVPLESALLDRETRRSDPSLPPMIFYGHAVADASGRFVLEDLPEGPYHLSASLRAVAQPISGAGTDVGRASTLSGAVESVAGDDSSFRIVLSGNAPSEFSTVRVSGSVVDDATGVSLTHFEVLLRSGDQSIGGLRTAPGEFVFEQVPAGTWTLEASALEYATAISAATPIVPPHEPAPLEMRMRRGATVRGRLRAPAGVSLGKAELSFRESGTDRFIKATIDRSGRYKAVGFLPASYAVIFHDARHGERERLVYMADQELVVGVGETHKILDVPLIAAAPFLMVVRGGAPGRAFGLFRLRVVDRHGDEVFSSRAVARNEYHEGVLPFGEYTVFLEGDRIEPMSSPVVVESGERPKVSFELP